jgi:hypothetical protein
MTKRDQIAEIAEVKARGLSADHRFSVATTHLRALLNAIDELEDAEFSSPTNWEVYRGFPVVVTATLESYFRATVATLIDSGDPFRARVRDFKDLKLDVAMLLAMEGERVTLGELVAHTLSLNNPDELGAAFEMVSGEKIWPQLVDRNREAATGQPYFFPATDEESRAYFYGSLGDLYRVRHIVCHEARSNVEVDAATARGFCDTAIEFLLIVDYLVDGMLGPESPSKSRPSRA